MLMKLKLNAARNLENKYSNDRKYFLFKETGRIPSNKTVWATEENNLNNFKITVNFIPYLILKN